MEAYKKQAEAIKAIAHPVRLRIVEILAEGETCVCHLTAILGQRQPYVSQQLTVLREADLVYDHREGVMVYYRLADERVYEVVRATRLLLEARGEDVEFAPVPACPVEGCPCPKCERARGGGA
ncbi:MAG: ArsR/SmtB family transcription factor [Anaerolineales bacterium]